MQPETVGGFKPAAIANKKTANSALNVGCFKTSQELPMLSTVTLDCQVTKIVMNLGSQLYEL